LGKNQAGVADHLVGFVFVPQNAIKIELCLRITAATTALRHLIGAVKTQIENS
jgi:hypothetical protein